MKDWVKWVFVGLFVLIVAIAFRKCADKQEAQGKEAISSSVNMMIAAQSHSAMCNHTDDTFNCVEYLHNYDGDTVMFNIPNVHPLLGRKINIRLQGIDTPELKTSDQCEHDLAIKAKQAVAKLLSTATRIDLKNAKRDKYFRIDADIHVDNKSISVYLLEQNLGYEYHGGTKPKQNWCNFSNN